MRIVSNNFPCRNIIYFNQRHELHKSCIRMHKPAKSYCETFPISSPCEWLETFIRLAKGPSFSNSIFRYDNFSMTWGLFNSAKCDKLNVFITEPGNLPGVKKSLKQFYDNLLIADVHFVINSLFIGKRHNQTWIAKPDGPPWEIYGPKLKLNLFKHYSGPKIWPLVIKLIPRSADTF